MPRNPHKRNTITVSDLNNHQRLMEAGIRNAIADCIAHFEHKTGYTPCSIDVELQPVQKIGEPVQYLATQVSSSVRLAENL